MAESAVKEEVEAVRNGSGLFDASDTAVIRIAGSDAVDFLQNLTSNDVKKLPVGQLHYSSLLDRKGRVQSLFSLLRTTDSSFLLLVQADLKERTIELLQSMKFIQQVELTDESDKWGLLWVIGPEAISVVGDALGLHGDMMITENKVIIPPDKSAWNLWQHNRWSVPAVGFLLPQGDCPEALSLLRDVGASPVSQSALDLVRLEKEIPKFGVEVDETRLLLEANLNDSFARNKGCYPGQEVIERICAYGDGKTPIIFKILHMKSNVELNINSDLMIDEKKIGTVVRTLYDPLKDQTLVAAYVQWAYRDDADSTN